MLRSALFETLALLRGDEPERFHKFVQSPFFNDGPYARDVLALWEYLRGHTAGEHSEDRVYRAIYPNKVFVKGKVAVLMSKLHQLLKQFAAHTTPPPLATPESVRLAAFFIDRGAAQRAAVLLEKHREAQSPETPREAGYWMERFLTELQQHRLETFRQGNHAFEHLAEAIRCLHHGYLVQMLELLNDLFFSRRKLKLDDSFAEKMADNIPSALHIADVEGEPLLRLLGKGFDFVRWPEKNDLAALENFHRELETHAGALPPDLLKTLFTYARNHCTWHYNHGDAQYVPLSVALFKSCLERGFLHDNGKIHAFTLLNLVQTGLVAGEFAWVKNALEQCREHIIGVSNPIAFYQYNLANYHYHLGEYDRALDLLSDSSDDLFNTLMVRKLEIKIYYETDSVLLDSKIDNFKLFIFRQGKKNLAENVFRMNNAFIDILRSMMSSKTVGNAAKAQKLLQKLDDTELVAERAWLRAQLELLANCA